MKLTQHVPGFVDTDKFEEVTFTTLEEMLAGEWPARINQREGFYRFSISDNLRLMAEYKEGFEWWVVGFFSEGDPSTLGLPKFKTKYPPKPNPTWQDIVKTRPNGTP
jgi:hypothetical protein